MNTYFTTITVVDWEPVFELFPDCNNIITSTFSYLANNKIAAIYGFVLMRDHMHIMWCPLDISINELIKKFKQFTGNQIIRCLYKENMDYLVCNFSTNRADRDFQFWKLKSGSLEIKGSTMFCQKLNYMHQNPVRGGYVVCKDPSDYFHSSAKSYRVKESLFSFLTLKEF